jgi:hypothetical protein
MYGIKDDTEMFKLFALYDKAKHRPERLTKADKQILKSWGVVIA